MVSRETTSNWMGATNNTPLECVGGARLSPNSRNLAKPPFFKLRLLYSQTVLV